MTRISCLSTLFLILLGTAVSQTREQIDLHGTWEFEKSSSFVITPKSHKSTVVIKQDAAELTITTETKATIYDKQSGTRKPWFEENSSLSYFSDGRGEVNVLANGDKIYSRTEWKGNKLRISFFSGPAEEKKRETLGTVKIALLKDGRLIMEKSGRPQGVPAELAALQTDPMAVVYISLSLANRKDIFRLVSK